MARRNGGRAVGLIVLPLVLWGSILGLEVNDPVKRRSGRRPHRAVSLAL